MIEKILVLLGATLVIVGVTYGDDLKLPCRYDDCDILEGKDNCPPGSHSDPDTCNLQFLCQKFINCKKNVRFAHCLDLLPNECTTLGTALCCDIAEGLWCEEHEIPEYPGHWYCTCPEEAYIGERTVPAFCPGQ